MPQNSYGKNLKSRRACIRRDTVYQNIQKNEIYNTYVRSILKYNCSTWQQTLKRENYQNSHFYFENSSYLFLSVRGDNNSRYYSFRVSYTISADSYYSYFLVTNSQPRRCLTALFICCYIFTFSK